MMLRSCDFAYSHGYFYKGIATLRDSFDTAVSVHSMNE